MKQLAELGRATEAHAAARSLAELRIKIFADGADRLGMLELARRPYIRGFTTNPTLMRKAGVTDYRAFARDVLAAIPDRSISFEVFADDSAEMERQAREIASWGEHVYVKIPVTDTAGRPMERLIYHLSHTGVRVNVTAMMTIEQVRWVSAAVAGGAPCYVSVFAGRIADTGRDPLPMMSEAVATLANLDNAELLWASPRELLNIFQANDIGCHVITVTSDLLNKLEMIGHDLARYSLETVRMFYRDAAAAGYQL